MINRENIKAIYGLSPMQRNMIYSYAVNSPAKAYTEQFDFHIQGELHPEKLKWALNQIVQKYDIFRTIFSYRNTDEPKQIVLKEGTLNWIDLNINSDEDVDIYKDEDLKKGFDIGKEILIRGALIKMRQKQWRFILTFHHIIVDGWSLAPILEELFQLYHKKDSVQVELLNQEEVTFSSYINWLESRNQKMAESYWKDYLKGYENVVSIPEYSDLGSFHIETDSTYQRKIYEFKLSDSLTDQLKQIAKDQRVAINAIIQTSWGILLQKLNYLDDVVYGMVVSGRNTGFEGVDKIKGLLINAVPMRITTEPEDTFISLCKKVQERIFTSAPYEYYPLSDIQSQSQLRNKLINHVMAFENYPLAEELQDTASKSEGEFSIEKVDVYECSDYDFNIIVIPGNEIRITFIYNENKYNEETMKGISQSFIQIFTTISTREDILVKKLNICTQDMMDEQLVRLNSNKTSNCSDQTVNDIFSHVSDLYKDKTALVYMGAQFTYQEVEQLSNHIKIRLIKNGVKPKDFVGVFMPRCPEYVITILGILKAGATYVPIDLGNSAERIKFITRDSNIKIMCTITSQDTKIKEEYPVLYIDLALDPLTSEYDYDTPQGIVSTPDHLAYMMYTSGSTGEPKGCKITHRNIVNLLFEQEYIALGTDQVIMQVASPSFDVSTFEIWGALLHGGTLVLPEPEDIVDVVRLENLINNTRTSCMVFTSSLFNRLCDANSRIFSSLQYLLLGGEPLSVPHVKKFIDTNKDIKVINAYGPTETTAFSTTHMITADNLLGKRIPIGKAITNLHVYIVDNGNNILPVGAIGELCIGGKGVGAGYHNREVLTKKRFISDCLLSGEQMYLTGDLARALPDGTIDILRRIDNQVKVRGYRIELGEIEHAMKNLPNINQVLVQVKELNEEKHICAYYTATGEVDVSEWKSILNSKMISYMVPTFYIRLNQIPITVNGKVDSVLLPSPQLESKNELSLSAENSEVREIIVEVCSSVAGLEKESVNSNTNFFDMGITSLNMITINNRLNKKLKITIPLSKLFEYNTIAKLHRYLTQEQEIDDIDNEEVVKATKINKDKMLSLLSKSRSMGE